VVGVGLTNKKMDFHRLIVILCAALLPWGAAAQDPAGEAAKPLKADPAADLYLVAQLAYQEAVETKDPALKKATYLAAVGQFSRFLQFHPDHAKALDAWYYSAVCYQKRGQDDAARRCLNAVVEDGKDGRLAGAAANQLARYHYGRKDWTKAASYYAVAARASEDPAIRRLSVYQRALCFQKLGETAATMKVLEEVLADPDSPYRARAEGALAHYYKKNGREKEALVLFERLAKSSKPETRAEATLQAALLARDLKQTALAESYFEKILTTPGLDEWRGEAQLVLMSSANKSKDHQRVVTLFKQGDFKLKKDQQVARILLVIQAHKALGQEEESFALYRQLERLSPQSKTGFEAAYLLLSRSYNTGQKNFVVQAKQFLERYGKTHPDDARIHNARLMLAETHFQAKAHAKAAETYASIDLGKIDPENHAGIRYRLATARLEAGDAAGAIAAFTGFLKNHPDDPRTPSILAKRADAHLGAGQTNEALRDFETLITTTTDPRLLEYAWAEKAMIHKEAKQLAEFIECHRHLLADIPKRDASRQAASHFWIGWGLFRLNEFAEGIPHFLQARDGAPEELGRESTLHLALSYCTLQQAADLEPELERLIRDYPKAKVPRYVFAWLGVKLSQEQKNYDKAWRFLPRAVTPDEPVETKTLVWRAHARTALETGHFRDAIPSLTIMLERDESPYQRAESYYFLGRANFGLNDLEAARTAAEEALLLKPQGELNAWIRLLLGDIALAENDAASAAKYYVLVAELYSSSPEIEKSALRRAAAALGDLGSPEALKDAKRYRERLKILDQAAQAKP
jgi:tetratricopeptide (TPR) repeat protein